MIRLELLTLALRGGTLEDARRLLKDRAAEVRESNPREADKLERLSRKILAAAIEKNGG